MPKKIPSLPKTSGSPTPPSNQCLTKCYPADAPYLHPLTKEVRQYNRNTCATYPYAKDHEQKWHQKCDLGSSLDHLDNLEMTITFRDDALLRDLYQIDTIRQYLTWVDRNHHTYPKTIDRICNSAWKTFVKDDQDLLDDLLEYHRAIVEHHCQKHDPSALFTLKQMYTLAMEALEMREQWNRMNLMKWFRKTGQRISITR